MQQDKLCHVRYCRYNTTHVTRGHKCNICHKYGHGQFECGKPNLIDNLQIYDDLLTNTNKCDAPNCIRSEYHTIEGHRCGYCKRFGHSLYTCKIRQSTTQSMSMVGVVPVSVIPVMPIILPIDYKCHMCRSTVDLNKSERIFGFTIECAICLDNSDDCMKLECGHGMCTVCHDKIKTK